MPGLAVCSTCYIPPEGNVSVSEDCIQRTQIVVTGALNVTGVPDANGVLPKIIGGGSNRLFKVESGGELVVRSLNLTGGRASEGEGGAISVSGHNSYFKSTNCSFEGNSATGSAAGRGGAVHGRHTSVIIIDSSTIQNNNARLGGGIGGNAGVHMLYLIFE